MLGMISDIQQVIQLCQTIINLYLQVKANREQSNRLIERVRSVQTTLQDLPCKEKKISQQLVNNLSSNIVASYFSKEASDHAIDNEVLLKEY